MAALEEFTGYKEESITVLKATRIDRRIEVETGGAVFEWDLARGGQITRCDVKTLAGAKPLLSGGQLAGNLTLDLGDGAVSLAEKPVEAEFGRHDEHCYVFSTKSRLADSFTVQQQWEVFREGVVFCEFNLQLDSGKEVCLREGQMRFPLEVLGAREGEELTL